MTFDPNQAKSILQSVTFWGAVLTVVAMSFPATAAKFGLTSATNAAYAQDIVQGIGAIVVVIGRLRAKQVATLTAPLTKG